jgi:hypothetical protein
VVDIVKISWLEKRRASPARLRFYAGKNLSEAIIASQNLAFAICEVPVSTHRTHRTTL